MKWSNIRLILHRELRDQFRDRRTLFMIAVLPILLYPLMGMAYLQIAQFMQEHPVRVWLIGVDSLPASPPLVTDDHFDPSLFANPKSVSLVELSFEQPELAEGEDIASVARESLVANEFDAVVYFPPGMKDRMQIQSDEIVSDETLWNPEVFFLGAKDRSRAAFDRVNQVLGRWRTLLVKQTLADREIPADIATPFRIQVRDVSESASLNAAIWSKILPFILIVWALTGAFYPAIDICAGEKERGTLETLLSSPAERNEIVWGKLLTVMVFSVATSLLNLFSLVLTGTVIISHLGFLQSNGSFAVGPPPLHTMGWLMLALLPLAAMFSALALAFATLARSSKEGQYYLLPLLLVTMPLATLPVMPTTEINLGTSLIPVTGVMLLLRCLIEGDYLTALKFVGPVTVVTLTCCWAATRWAVKQFNEESVLFRENERFDVFSWVRHLFRDRGDTPSLAEALMCGVLLLVLKFFAQLAAATPTSWRDVVVSTSILQIALIAGPALLMAVMLTGSVRKTLLLRMPRFTTVIAAILLAFFLHPLALSLSEFIQRLYPISPDTIEQLAAFSEMITNAPLWQKLALMALLPAVCEELAFRGFILSGLRHIGSKGMAIIVSSLFFAVLHSILQQSLAAFFLGMVIGYVAIHTGSILPCIVFHAIHNSLQLIAASFFQRVATGSAAGEASAFETAIYNRIEPLVVESTVMPGMYVYRIPVIIVSIIAAGVLLYWFRSLPYVRTPEEELQDALEHQSDSPR